MSRGWWTLGRLKGAPIRLHFSVALGALFWSHFSFAPAVWLSFVLLILFHELGHALFVLRFRLGLAEIAVHGAGGYCRHERSGSRFEEAAIAWGGVLAQLLLFVVVSALLLLLGPPTTPPVAQVAHVWTEANLWLIAINLIPIEPLDGAKAWPLIGMLLSRFRQRSGPQQREPVRRNVADELRDLERADRGPSPQSETPSERTDRIVRELIERTTQPKR